MKQINIWLFALVFSMSLLFSCGGDFLEKEPHDSYSQDIIFTDIELARGAMIGCYDNLSNVNSWYGRNFVIIGDLAADNTKVRPVNSGRFLEDYFYFKNKDLSQAGFWFRAYETIARCNYLISGVDGGIPNATDEESNQLKGEALFLRALAHFDLCRLFAQDYNFTDGGSHMGVPVVTSVETFGQPIRNTVAEVYAAVISDLEAALTLLDDSNYGATELPYRANTNAVNALLARVYLYKGDYTNAKQKAESVISSGSYTLFTNASYISAWGEAANDESIFDAAVTATDNLGVDGLGPMYLKAGYGDIAPTDGLIELYSIQDVRTGWFTVDGGDLYVNKYPAANYSDNTRVLRYSEMYLISAEASARLGEIAAGTARLNTIRTRAGLTEVSPNNAIELLTEVALEKRREFAFEGHRWFDLRRNQQGVERGDDCTANEWCSIPYPNDQFVYPIPQTEMNANPNMQQNPGY